MSQAIDFNVAAWRMLRALPKAEQGNASAKALVRLWLHRVAGFCEYEDAPLMRFGKLIGYDIEYMPWDARCETVALARDQGKPFFGIVVYRSEGHFDDYVVMVKQ